jgi:hypothetical protein
VLLVSKKLGIPEKSGKPPDVAALNTPNNPTVKDCQ